jgi:hypothetical protein
MIAEEERLEREYEEEYEAAERARISYSRQNSAN